MLQLPRVRRAPIGALACLLLVGGLAGCAAPEPPPEPEVLSATKAGGVYLDAVCPVNAAWDDADAELDRLRIAVARGGDVQIDTARFATAMERVAEASAEAGEQLDTEQQSWPAVAEAPVASVRKTLQADRKQAASVAKLDAAEAVAYAWQGAAESGEAAAAARAALGLPDDPEAACAQWEAQQAEREASDRGTGSGAGTGSDTGTGSGSDTDSGAGGSSAKDRSSGAADPTTPADQQTPTGSGPDAGSDDSERKAQDR
ncbi:hypothetical protein [Leucobacter chironomi]|uniref:hypothetical protein n=1 Tax=Leucobacter chironomi TaxID=491918 RepID=UPI0003F839D2|nr:hypothetical protein [Leucobacter chironomi]